MKVMPTVLITGTSTGIGEATTKALAGRGWRVFATMRDLKKAEALERSLNDAGIRQHVELDRLDVTDPTSIWDGVAATLSRTENRLDAVVHNAGVAAGGAFEDLPEAEVRRVMETNFFGVLECDATPSAFVPRPAARPHRHCLERGGLRRSAGKFDLLRLEMGAGGLGRVPDIRARAVRDSRHPGRARHLSLPDLGKLAPVHSPDQPLSSLDLTCFRRDRQTCCQDRPRSAGGR